MGDNWRRMLFIMSVLDLMSRVDEKGNVYSVVDEGIVKWLEFNRGMQHYAGFVKRRLSLGFAPYGILGKEKADMNWEKIKPILKARNLLGDKKFIRFWKSQPRVFVFALFNEILKDPEEFVDLVESIYGFARRQQLSDTQEIIIDTDVDFMGMPIDARKEYVDNLRNNGPVRLTLIKNDRTKIIISPSNVIHVQGMDKTAKQFAKGHIPISQKVLVPTYRNNILSALWDGREAFINPELYNTIHELAGNIYRHSDGGQIVVQKIELAGKAGISLIASNKTEKFSLSSFFFTLEIWSRISQGTGGQGMGLLNIIRYADEFNLKFHNGMLRIEALKFNNAKSPKKISIDIPEPTEAEVAQIVRDVSVLQLAGWNKEQFAFLQQDGGRIGAIVRDIHKQVEKAPEEIKLKDGGFDELLQRLWDERYSKGIFLYKIDNLLRKKVGRYMVQFNKGRWAAFQKGSILKSIIDCIRSGRLLKALRYVLNRGRDNTMVMDPFGSTGNFNDYYLQKPQQRIFQSRTPDGTPYVVGVNIAPILLRHFIVLLDPNGNHPQHLKVWALKNILEIASLSRSPNLYYGFNSRGAAASINHLHFHGVYYPDGEFSLFQALRVSLGNINGVEIERTVGTPVRALVFRSSDNTALAEMVMKFAGDLQQANIPHNAVIRRQEVILVPRTRVSQNALTIGHGFWDVAGEIETMTASGFKNISEKKIEAALGNMMLSERTFSIWTNKVLSTLTADSSSKAVNKTTIVHVSCQDPEHLAGGQGVAVLNIAQAQAAMGYQTVWISPCIRDEKPGENFYLDGKLRLIKVKFSDDEVLSLFGSDEKPQVQREMFGATFVQQIIQTFDPKTTFVHLHGFVEIPRRAKDLRQAGFQVVSTFHMFLSPRVQLTAEKQEFLSRLRKLEQEAIQANVRIIVNSQAMKDELYALCPNCRAEVIVLANGIGAEHFDFPRQPKEEQPLISTFGRISPEKGFDVFIDAAKRVTDKRRLEGLTPVRFVIFGKTDDAIAFRKEYRLKLEALAAGYDNIEIYFDEKGIWGLDKFRLLDRSWLGVIASTYEPFGLTLVEYMARGIPLIATSTHGSRDILEISPEGSSSMAIIVQPKAEALAQAMEEALADPAKMQEMARLALMRADSNYRWESAARKILGFYHTALTDDFNVSPLTADERMKSLRLFDSIEQINASIYHQRVRPLLQRKIGHTRSAEIQELVKDGTMVKALPFLTQLMENEIPGHPAPWEFFDALEKLLRRDEQGFHNMRRFTYRRAHGHEDGLDFLPIAFNTGLAQLVGRLVQGLNDEERELLHLLPFLFDIGRCVKPQGHPELGGRYVSKVVERLGFSPSTCAMAQRIIEGHTDIGTVFTTERHPTDLADKRWGKLEGDMLTILSIADRSYGTRAYEITIEAINYFVSALKAFTDGSMDASEWHLQRLAHYLNCSRESVRKGFDQYVSGGRLGAEDLVSIETIFGKNIRFIDYGDVVFKTFVSASDGSWLLVKLFTVISRILAAQGQSIRRLNMIKDAKLIKVLISIIQEADHKLDEHALRLSLLAKGMRLIIRGDIAQLVVDQKIIEQTSQTIDRVYNSLFNAQLEQKAINLGMDELMRTTDFSKEKGFAWFPQLMKYKVLDEGASREIPGAKAPKEGQNLAQYNLSRGLPRGEGKDGAEIKGCAFCGVVQQPDGDQVVADLEKNLGLPYIVVADSRPFFPGHKLVLEKGHTGKITRKGLRELLFIFKELFPGMRGNVGTGNQAAHLHIHVYDVEFPVERQQKIWLHQDKDVRIGLMVRDVQTGGFVVQSERTDVLADEAFRIIEDCEKNGWQMVVIAVPGYVYIVPQKNKEIEDRPDFKYPSILDAFKKNRPKNIRPRYVGPVEVAGIWLCYSRGNIPAMVEMYNAMTLEIYQNILRDTGVSANDPLFKNIVRQLFGSPLEIAGLAKSLRFNAGTVLNEKLEQMLGTFRIYLTLLKEDLAKKNINLEEYISIDEILDGIRKDSNKKARDTKFTKKFRGELIDVVDENNIPVVAGCP